MEVEGNEGHEQAGKADRVGPHWCSSMTFSSSDEMYGKGVKKGRLRENADKGGRVQKIGNFCGHHTWKAPYPLIPRGPPRLKQPRQIALGEFFSLPSKRQ